MLSLNKSVSTSTLLQKAHFMKKVTKPQIYTFGRVNNSTIFIKHIKTYMLEIYIYICIFSGEL